MASLKESDLQGHLLRNNAEADTDRRSNNNTDSTITIEDPKGSTKNKVPLINKDYQLHEALMVLKAMRSLNTKIE